MARPTKKGIDYFSHDVDTMQDPKMKLLRARYGLIGYGVFFRLLEELYRSGGYYLNIDDDFKILFCDDNNIEIEHFEDILNFCLEKNLFNQFVYFAHFVLTSERILRNYIQATERRTKVDIIREYAVDINGVNVDINAVNVNINSINVDIGTQSKVKESKVKKDYVHFDDFWKLWPKKKDKSKANKKWVSLKVDGELFEKIKAHLSIAKKTEQWTKNNGQFIPLPSTYLNNKRWEDEEKLKNIDKSCDSCVYKVRDKLNCWKENRVDCKSFIKI